MRSIPILNGAITKNTSGAVTIRHGDRNPFWEAQLALCATFGVGASSLVVSFDGSPDNDTWFHIQAYDLTTANSDLVESKTITADCTRQLLRCIADWPYVRVTWALTSDNNATLHLDCVSGAMGQLPNAVHVPVPSQA